MVIQIRTADRARGNGGDQWKRLAKHVCSNHLVGRFIVIKYLSKRVHSCRTFLVRDCSETRLEVGITAIPLLVEIMNEFWVTRPLTEVLASNTEALVDLKLTWLCFLY